MAVLAVGAEGHVVYVDFIPSIHEDLRGGGGGGGGGRREGGRVGGQWREGEGVK